MAKYSATQETVTPVAVADGSAATSAGYFGAVQGGTATQRNRFFEVFLGGQSSSSTVNQMVLGKDSTVASGTAPTSILSLTDSTASAPGTPPIAGNNWGTAQPTRSATLRVLSLVFNTYGGVVRWVASPDMEVSIYGNAANGGEMSLSSASGTGVIGGHIIFETV